MSKLNIDQQSVFRLFSDEKSDFLIPDYQRPYAWGEQECQTLWEDIFMFAFPEDDCDKFNKDEEYFLGPIVTYKNEGKQEIIDGQQRLTTLMLLLRAFYSKFENMKDKNSISIRKNIAKCIWKSDEFGNLLLDELKIDSQVSTDDDKDEFLAILRDGVASKDYTSRYADVFRFYEKKIDEFVSKYPSWCPYLPARIMNNCILLPIEAESQDTALRIFSTLNDRGKPLSDADIFKAQFYKYYSLQNKKDQFIARWKELEAISEKVFHPMYGTPMDELFTRYMYFHRAKQGNRNTTTEALRKFYEKDAYALLKREDTLFDLEALAAFWEKVDSQDDSFSDRILKRLFVLNYAPNGMWTYLVSVYYLQNRDKDNVLEEQAFYEFLNRITAFIWAYAFIRPGVNALRTPVYPEMIKIVNGQNASFSDYKFSLDEVKAAYENYAFSNGRPITKSMLAWWAYHDDKQPLLKLTDVLEIEHIYARKRQEIENSLLDGRNLESLGNKALLEKTVNIRAADYRFQDKAQYYNGFTNDKGKFRPGTEIVELKELVSTKQDFREQDIIDRNSKIEQTFLQYLKDNDLLK